MGWAAGLVWCSMKSSAGVRVSIRRDGGLIKLGLQEMRFSCKGDTAYYYIGSRLVGQVGWLYMLKIAAAAGQRNPTN